MQWMLSGAEARKLSPRPGGLSQPIGSIMTDVPARTAVWFFTFYSSRFAPGAVDDPPLEPRG